MSENLFILTETPFIVILIGVFSFVNEVLKLINLNDLKGRSC